MEPAAPTPPGHSPPTQASRILNQNTVVFTQHRGPQGPISIPTSTARTASTKRTSRRTVDTILNHGNTDPGVSKDRIKRQADAKQDLEGRKRNHPGLIEAFFGQDVLNPVASYHSLMLNLYANGRWNDIPPADVSSPDHDATERKWNTKFFNFVQKIRYRLTTSDERGFRETQFERYALRDGDSQHWLQPDISFWGKDSGSFAETSDGSSPDNLKIPPEWKWCIVLMEGKLGKRPRDEDENQLASYIREVFSAQFNRRFVPSFIFSPKWLKFYLFDRSGMVCSDQFDYHREPIKFVGIIHSLLKWDIGRLGFDQTITRERNRWFIEAHEEDSERARTLHRYIVDETLFHSTGSIGDCPACWRVKKEGQDDCIYYLIKDAWLIGGSDNEGNLLKRENSLPGVASMISHEDIIVKGTNQRDSVLNIRPRQSSADDSPPEDRVHTRIVMRLTGRAKPLEKFSNRMELLLAFRDAIAGHRNLYTSGILHRDITPFCILIEPGADCGNRGIIFDLHCAVRTDSTPSSENNLVDTFHPSLPDRRGSHAFHSYRALRHMQNPYTHHYIDDLESFYYSLCYMVLCHDGPGPRMVHPRPAIIADWFKKKSYSHKQNFLFEGFQLEVPPFFGSPVKTLLQHFHAFIWDQVSGSRTPTWTPMGVQGCKTVVGYFDDAIAAIDKEDNNKRPAPSILENLSKIKKRKFN